jgi:sec-independent protein translocase protein TatA
MTDLPLPILAFFGLGSQELFIVLLIVLVVFGASKLPKLGAGVGQSIRNFKKEMRKGKEEDVEEAEKSAPSTPRAVVQVEMKQPEAIESGAEVVDAAVAAPEAEAAAKVQEGAS